MSTYLTALLDRYARMRGLPLPPGWRFEEAMGDPESVDAVDSVAFALGWNAEVLRGKPKAQQFPVLVHHAEHGWAIGLQWANSDELMVFGSSGQARLQWSDLLVAVRLDDENSRLSSAETALSVFWAAVFRRKAAIVDAAVATVVINVLALATSFFSMQVYDRVIPHNGWDTLVVLTLGMGVALLLDSLIRYTRAMTIDREAAKIDGEVSAFFYERMQSVRMDARPRSIGTMAAQLRGLEQVRSLLSSATLFLLADLPFALLFIVTMGLLGGAVVIVPLIAFPLSIVAALVLVRFIRVDTDAAQVSGNRKNGILVESLDAAETIKANLGGWHMLGAWNRLIEEVHEHDLRVKRWSSLASTCFNFIQQIAYVAVICVGVLQVSEGRMTMGAVIACSILIGRVNGPLISQIPNFAVQFGYARSSLRALDNVLAMPTDRPIAGQGIRIEHARGALTLERVEFAHPGARNGLAVERFEVSPGERIGVLGPVGSGKSTLLRILSGLYSPQSGVALLDGVDMRQIAEDDLRRNVFYLAQEYKLVKGTLRENVTLGLGFVSDDDLTEAAQKTGLLDLVKQHPQGINLPIGEGGSGLSGGQRALVGLTRALLSKARVWLLDEPTANLDRETEAKVLNALLAVKGDAAVVIVTHKMQLVNIVGRLVIVAGGKVTLDGPAQAVIQHLQQRQAAAGAAQKSPVPARS